MSYYPFPMWCQTGVTCPILVTLDWVVFIFQRPSWQDLSSIIHSGFYHIWSSAERNICWAKAWWESFVAGDISLFKCQTCHHNVIISLSLGDKMSDRWERFVIWILSWICTGECSVHCESSKYLSAGRASGRTVPDLIISYKYLSSQQSWRIGQIKINDWTDVSFKWYQKYSLGLARRCWAVLLPRPPSKTLLA